MSGVGVGEARIDCLLGLGGKCGRGRGVDLLGLLGTGTGGC